ASRWKPCSTKILPIRARSTLGVGLTARSANASTNGDRVSSNSCCEAGPGGFGSLRGVRRIGHDGEAAGDPDPRRDIDAADAPLAVVADQERRAAHAPGRGAVVAQQMPPAAVDRQADD